MPRTLLLVGIGLTVLGLGGLVVTLGKPAAGPWVRYLFIPAYAAGAITLLMGGVIWLRRWSRGDRP
jgi:hypothetical protein